MLLRELTNNINQGKATAILGWGRGMGHKGHMLLAQAVIHYANKFKAEPYFVVSRTSVVDPSTGDVWADRAKLNRTKDDPLTPNEKLAIYRRVFPDQSHIFSVATEDATKLEQVMAKLVQQGFKNIVLVVGEDQKNALGFLQKADKSGTSPVQQMGLASLKIISRQDTKAPGSDVSKPDYQEGPRATPMRQVLLDPTKNEQEQFAVWRRDMPDNLGDEEVMQLMQTAKSRLIKAHTPAVRGKKGVAEGRDDPLSKSVQQAGPYAKRYDGMADTFYPMYRFGIAMAGNKDTPSKGPVRAVPTLWMRNAEEAEIVAKAERIAGIKGTVVVPNGDSDELLDTNTTSAVAKVKRNKYGI
jgi:hypothetical protein